MLPIFVFNNIYFTVEILGALVFLMISWLAVDAYLSRRDFLTASRGIGFGFLALGQVMNSLVGNGDFFDYSGHTFFILGAVFVLWNLFLESPISRNTLQAMMVLPSISVFTFYSNSVAVVLLSGIAFLAFRQYLLENKKSLIPFVLSFTFLAVGYCISLFYDRSYISSEWAYGLFFEFLGYAFLARWLWNYLRVRSAEKVVSILVFIILIISVAVTFIFSIIITGQIEEGARSDLYANRKALEISLRYINKESLAKAKLFAENAEVRKLLNSRVKDISAIKALADDFARRENMDFLIVADDMGIVLERTNSVARKGDSLIEEKGLLRALVGKESSGIDYGKVEKLSARAYAPIMDGIKPNGVVIAGYFLNDLFAGNLKNETGLDIAIYKKDILVASTILEDEGMRMFGASKITDTEALESIFIAGESISLKTSYDGGESMASFVPLKDVDGVSVGALVVLRPQKDIVVISNTTNILTLMSIIIVVLLLITPTFIATKRQ